MDAVYYGTILTPTTTQSAVTLEVDELLSQIEIGDDANEFEWQTIQVPNAHSVESVFYSLPSLF